MSYILNALRKSEQERKALKPDDGSVTTPLLAEKPVAPRKLTKVIWFGVLMNLAILAYLYFRFDAPVPTPIPPFKAAVATKPGVAIAPPVLHEDRPQTAPAISTQPVLSAVKTPAISDLWAENQQAQDAEALKMRVSQPIPKVTPIPTPLTKKKPPAVLASKAEKLALKKPEAQKLVVAEVPVSLPEPLPRPVERPVVEPIAPPKHSDVPYLRELSADFQAKVPPSTINVLAYADQANARFVIIDMVKYRIGERVKSKISLVDILPDSVVMNYEGQRFRLERP